MGLQAPRRKKREKRKERKRADQFLRGLMRNWERKKCQLNIPPPSSGVGREVFGKAPAARPSGGPTRTARRSSEGTAAAGAGRTEGRQSETRKKN